MTEAAAVLAGGLRLSYAAQGDPSGPAVVFLPGPTDSWRSYQRVLEHLPASLRAVAVSQRGHGHSDKPGRGYGVADFAADVPPLLDVLGIPAAVLVGHSGSCLVARRVAIEHPARVRGLVLEASPSTLVGDPGLTAFVEEVVSGLEDPIDLDLARSLVVDTSSSDLRPEDRELLVQELRQAPARVWREMFEALLHDDDREQLARLRAPTLLLWGDADPLVGRAAQEELLARIPAARSITYPGAGHTPRWEHPARFAADVAAFVEAVERG